MRQKVTMALLLTLSAIALSGCQTTKVQTVILTPEISQAIRVCADKPAKPDGEYTQRDVARFITNLDAAHTSCKRNLAAVDESLRRFESENPR